MHKVIYQQSKSRGWVKKRENNSQPRRDFMQAMLVVKIKQRRCIWLTSWTEFDAGNVNNRNQKGGVHDSQAGWEFIQANISNRNQAEDLDMTHLLDRSLCRQCQQWKSSRGAGHDSHPGQKFMQAMSTMEIKQRSWTWLTAWTEVHIGNVSNRIWAEELDMTHRLDRSSCRQCQQWKSSRGAGHD